jgi:deoxyribose-phosphate aldolase
MLPPSADHDVPRRCYRPRVVRLEALIEHTLLAPEARAADYARLCEEAVSSRIHGVCVPSSRVHTCAEQLAGRAKVVTVIGYPLGAVLTSAKVAETIGAIADGADELDVVLDVGRLRDGDRAAVLADLRAVVAACEGRPLKVILETGLLDDTQKRIGAQLAVEAGAAFVKTCTGMPGRGVATVADVLILREAIGPTIGIKASGGIRTARAALELIDAGATRIGTSAGPKLLAELVEGIGT